MTARWSRRLSRMLGGNAAFARSSARLPAGFFTAIDQVSKSGASAGARNANVGCRNGFEASWRCAQVEPRGETSSSAERR